MVRATLLSRGGQWCGFRICGHAGGLAGTDIVCAAISSAAILAANTLTDVCGVHTVSCMRDGYLFFSVTDRDLDRCGDTLEGLRRHLADLQQQFPKKLQLDTETL